jgi:ABC-type transport system substrate-binding protein
VNVEVELFESDPFAANANKDRIRPGTGALGWSWIGNPPFNVDRFFTMAFAPPNGANWGAYKSDKVEELLGQVGKASDREERLKLYRDLDAQIVEDAPWLFLMYPGEVGVSSKNLRWVSANATFFTLRNASMA